MSYFKTFLFLTENHLLKTTFTLILPIQTSPIFEPNFTILK